jgi:DNA-binding SARP family transcriptional activator
LLGLLALRAGADVTADRLVEELWQGRPPDAAAATLQSHVARLRRALGVPAAVETRPAGYRLASRVDADEFEDAVAAARRQEMAGRADTLRAALAAWRGAAYDGLRDLAPLATEGERLDEQHLVATLACVDAEHALGRTDGHVEALDTLVRRHRVSEPLWARLMRALYAADRQADALAAYQRARVALRDELGIEPGEALRQVEHLVLTQDPSLRPGSTGPLTDGGQERRRVTVLAAEVADDEEGTTDPEVAAAASRRVALRSVVERHGGLLLPSPGVTAFAVFGAPVAHGDDAARATGAAEALLVERVAIRVGLATGLVVTEAGGQPRAGQVTQRAERLARAARRGEVRLDPATRATAVGEGAPGVAAPFVGRGDELATLRQALDAATTRETAQLATVVAEAGMGKSRLVAELLAQMTTEAVEVRTAVCPSYGEAAGLQVIGRLLGEDPRQPEDHASRYDAYERWAGTLRTAAGDRALVVFVDDLHWADELVTGFLVHLLSGGHEGPLLVLAAARPELHRRHPAWGQAAAAATSLRLGPLGAQDVDALVASLAAVASGVDAAGTERIAEESGGVPLHAVELARLAVGDGPAVESGSTLTSVLQARLDTLSPSARATVVDASVVGKRFRIGALAALGARPLAEVQTDVAELVEREFLRRLPGDFAAADTRELVFTHDLVRAAAYERLLRRDAAVRHLATVRWAEHATPADPAFLAHHALRAHDLADGAGDGELAEAARPLAQRYADDAGSAALGLETDAAIRLLQRAVELAEPGGLALARAQCRLGQALFDRGLFAEAGPVLRAGLSGLEGVPDPLRIETCQWEMWNHFATGLDMTGPRAEMTGLIAEMPDTVATVTAMGVLAALDLIHQTPESQRAAIVAAEEAIALAQRLGHPEHTGLARSVRGRARLGLGDAGGLREMEEAQADLERYELGTFQVAYQIWRAGAEHHWSGPEAELATRRRLAVTAEQRGLSYMTSFSVAEEVRCLAELGRFREAIALAETVDATNEAQPRWAVVQRALCLADLGELDPRTVAAVAATPPASDDDLRHVLGQLLVAGTAAPADVPALVERLGDLTPYAQRDGAVELLPRLVRMAGDAGAAFLVAGLPDVTGAAPLAQALGAHLRGLLQRETALLGRAADGWKSMGQRVEHAFALLDLAEATPRDEPAYDDSVGRARQALLSLGMVPWVARLPR